MNWGNAIIYQALQNLVREEVKVRNSLFGAQPKEEGNSTCKCLPQLDLKAEASLDYTWPTFHACKVDAIIQTSTLAHVHKRTTKKLYLFVRLSNCVLMSFPRTKMDTDIMEISNISYLTSQLPLAAEGTKNDTCAGHKPGHKERVGGGVLITPP